MSRYSLVTSITMIILAMSLSLMLTTDISLAQGPSSHTFKGKIVDAMGQPAKEGIEIRALIDGNVVAEGISGNGQYKLLVSQPQGASFAGKTITFTGGQFKIKETAQWVSGANTVLNLTSTINPSALNQVRGKIAGFIDPNKNTRQTDPPSSPNQNKNQIERQINQEKNQRLLQIDQQLEQELARIEQDSQQQISQHKFNYENELSNIERDSQNSDGETQRLQHELENVRLHYNQEKQNNPSSRRISELQRDMSQLQMVIKQNEVRQDQEKARRINNAKQEYDRHTSEATRSANEQINRIKQEKSREKSNIEREFSQMLREQLENVSRENMEQDRMAREEQLNEDRYKKEEERMNREMEMQEDRMNREMEMQDERMNREMEMEERRMQMGPGMGPGMGQGQDPSRGTVSGEPHKTRGFLMNPKPGTKIGGINSFMDPTMLAIFGISITVLTTGLTLFKGN